MSAIRSFIRQNAVLIKVTLLVPIVRQCVCSLIVEPNGMISIGALKRKFTAQAYRIQIPVDAKIRYLHSKAIY
jgi:hypothetical protein